MTEHSSVGWMALLHEIVFIVGNRLVCLGLPRLCFWFADSALLVDIAPPAL